MGEIAGILLAAGRSSRFGADKLLHPLPDGTPIGVAAARHLLEAVPLTIAVVPPDNPRLYDLLHDAGCRVRVNPRATDGMGSSIAAGVGRSRDAAGWLIALADMPWIRPETIQSLVQRLSAGATTTAPVYQGRRGHPVGFSAEWGDRLCALEGDAGARRLIAANGGRMELVRSSDPGVVRDVDHPGDLGLPDAP